MNFHRTEKLYRWFPTISGQGNEKLLSMGFDILGLAAGSFF